MSLFNSKEQSNRFKKIRKELKMSQEDISEVLEVTQAYVSGIEKGNRELSKKIIYKLTECYKMKTKNIINLNWLLMGIGEKEITSNIKQKIIGGDNNQIQVGNYNNMNINEYRETLNKKDLEIEKLKAQIQILQQTLLKKN
jgi:transcriptional regulator with XRE-family HTH domain